MRLMPCVGFAILFFFPHLSPAMILSPRGTGQVLLFPYYPVNKHQQTPLSVTNTTSRGKAIAVRIREGYNGRTVLGFNVFLAPNDFWSGIIFALSDAGLKGTGAGIATSDLSCTLPDLLASSTKLSDGTAFQLFPAQGYTGANADTGPADDARTREGTIEMFEMAEITGDTLRAINSKKGLHDCSGLPQRPPDSDLTTPTGGLVGAAFIINVADGTLFSTEASAIDGFFSTARYSDASEQSPNLSDASVHANGLIPADIPLNGAYVRLNYPAAQSVDSVSALLMANRMFGNWETTSSLGAQTDWVISFPTKRLYVDTAITGPQTFPKPFAETFGQFATGRSDVTFEYEVYDREGVLINIGPTGSSTVPFVTSPPLLAYSTQVATFTQSPPDMFESASVLGSNLSFQFPANDTIHSASSGSAILEFTLQPFEGARSELRPSVEGVVVEGLPVIGFEAVNYINANVQPNILANYSGTYPLKTALSCDQFVDGLLPDVCD